MDKTTTINCIIAVIILFGLSLCFIAGCNEPEYSARIDSGNVVASYQACGRAGKCYVTVVERSDGSRVTSYLVSPGYIPVVGDKVKIKYFKGTNKSEIGR